MFRKALLYCCLLLSNHCLSFDGGEHALIANLAFANGDFPRSNQITNLEKKIYFSYGELVAMAGDMYESVEEIALNDPKILNGFFSRNRNSLKQCIASEIDSINAQKEYSGCDDLRLASKKFKYVLLAHDNYKHFTWHNIKAYVEHHSNALWFANLAFLKCDEEQKQQTPDLCIQRHEQFIAQIKDSNYKEKLKSKYRKFPKLFPRKSLSKLYLRSLPKNKLIDLALFENAFADHFLTDAFSAGHLRIPRSQIDFYVENYKKEASDGFSEGRAKSSTLSGALTQLLHNSDGALKGTQVINSLGNRFTVRSDKQLFSRVGEVKLTNDFANNKQLTYPVEAVTRSLNELFFVVKKGRTKHNEHIYSALELVPFVDSAKADPIVKVMSELIESKGSAKRLVDQMTPEMALIFKGLLLAEDSDYEIYLTEFITNIPTLMENLRARIHLDAKDAELKQRIPTPLLNGLLQIQ